MRTRRSTRSSSISSAASSAVNALLSAVDPDHRFDESCPSTMSSSGRRSRASGDDCVVPSTRRSYAERVECTRYSNGDYRLNESLPAAVPNLVVLCLFGAGLALLFAVALRAGIATVGLAAPAWATFKALEKRPGSAALETWARFWILAGLLFALDKTVMGAIVGAWLPDPFYSAMLFSAVMWLSTDNAKNSNKLYVTAIQPLFLRYETSIDAFVEGASEKFSDLSRYGLIQVSNALRPLAMQLDHAASRAQEEHDRVLSRRNTPAISLLASDDEGDFASRPR